MAKWFKGNIHTHTTESDGDETPEKVVRWFRRHGYDFLVLSDHNHVTLLNYGTGKRRFKRPLMIPGEEVSARIKGGAIPIHINGIGISRVIEPIDGGEIVPTIQANVDAIIQAGGIASLNHPNYQWSFDHTHISQVTGASLLEVFNGHPATNIYGAPGKSNTEEIWDGVLSSGRHIYGVATDDSHNYHDFTPSMSNPGRGWVMVRSDDLNQDAILNGLETGQFYASTGVELSDLVISAESLDLTIKPVWDNVYTTTFIGKSGKILSSQVGLEASYQPQGNEGYVRAQVTDSGHKKAWTQPVFLNADSG